MADIRITSSTVDIIFTYYEKDGATIAKAINLPKDGTIVVKDVKKNTIYLTDSYCDYLNGKALEIVYADVTTPSTASVSLLAAAIIALKDA